MVPLGPSPVLVAMVRLILIQVKTGESLGATLVPDTVHLHGTVGYNSSSGERKGLECPKGSYPHPTGTHCCNTCHKGTYVAQHCSGTDKRTNCTVCPPGAYTEAVNHADKCFPCQKCRPSFGQIPVSSCTSDKDTVCGCGSNQYRSSNTDVFVCKNCSACHNGEIRQSCSNSSDTICECHLGFFLKKDENKCFPCSSCSVGECNARCGTVFPVKTPQNSSDLTLILGLLVGFFGISCVLLLMRKIITQSCQNRLSSTFSKYYQQPTREPSLKVISKANDYVPEATQREGLLLQNATSADLPDCVRAAGERQIPDRPEVLYTVVDRVPVSRWKEFVRRLGLTENAIERIYAEHRHIREAQYDMLKQWRLQAGHSATVEHISSVLNQMEMSGCSEAIQEVLPKLP